jgi:hypothetical protein
MTTETRSTPAPSVPYGCAPEYTGPPIDEIVRSVHHGRYRRPAIDLATGQVQRGDDGAVQYDEGRFPARDHLRYVAKGYALVAILDGAEVSR